MGPYHEGLPKHFGGLSIFSGGGTPYDPGGNPLVEVPQAPGFLGGGPPGPPWPPGVGPPCPTWIS